MADDYAGYFSGLEQQYGLPSGYLTGASGIETRGGQLPDRNGSQYQGLFQLGAGVRATYGVTDPQDWRQNARGAAQFAADNMKQLNSSLGRAPTASELYLAHQQGAGGAASLIKAGDTPAGQAVEAANIAGNGGDPSAPASTFVNMWGSRFNNAMHQGSSAGMSYTPMASNSLAKPATPSGILSAPLDWAVNTESTPGAAQNLQQVASAISPQPQAPPAPQSPVAQSVAQLGNQLASQRQMEIQQRAQALLTSLSKRA